MSEWIRHLRTVVRRELQTILRTRSVAVLGAVYAGLVIGMTWYGETNSYVPLVLTLLTPLELLIPAFTAALTYRAFASDRDRGELSIVQTYPVSKLPYVAGVYIGRLGVLLVLVLVPIMVAGGLVSLNSVESTFLATHSGLDSPILFFRFVVLTGLFTAVVTAIVLAVSAGARSTGRGLTIAIVAVLMLAVGLDLAVVLGLVGDYLPDESVWWVLSASPNSAYRGLVMALVIDPVAMTEARPAQVAANLVGLFLWWTGPLLFAMRSVWKTE